MNKRILFLTIMTFLFISIIIPRAYCQQHETGENWNSENENIIRAKVLNVESKTETELPTGAMDKEKNQLITVKLLSGQFSGKILEIPHVIMDQPGYDIVINPGDEVIVYIASEGSSIKSAYISDYARDKKLLYLTVGFVCLLTLLGGKKGVKSIFSLAIIGAVIYLILLPLILQGYNPIIVTVLISAAVTAVTLITLGGISAKTFSAIIGTTGGVLIAGILAFTVGTAAHLTGFSDEEMHMLLYSSQNITFDYHGILFSGMIIGALGAVMDVGVSIASAVEEIKKANPLLRTGSLIRAGMSIGRDIMGTMADTLILAYTGSSMPLMLVFMAYDTPFLKVINLDLIATEIVRSLAGSIGLIIAVPITAITAGILFGSTRIQPKRPYDFRAKGNPFNF